jgi:hypothetical protein
MFEAKEHWWWSRTPDKSIPLATVFAATECLPCLLDLLPVRDVPLNDQMQVSVISSIR